jgi:hypothetical protein
MSDKSGKPHHPSYILLSPDYRVGYRKPPVANQFKPGQSGNPKGRPKSSVSLAGILGKVLYEKISLTENGRLKDLVAIEGMLKVTRSRAFKGDIRATRFLIGLAEKHKVEQPTQTTRAIQINFVEPDPDLVAQADEDATERTATPGK